MTIGGRVRTRSERRSAALVVAAGRGQRFGGDRPKQYAMLGGRPVVRHCLDSLVAHPGIDAVLVVIAPQHEAMARDAALGLDGVGFVVGAEDRQSSVRLGLEALTDTAPDSVLIHDGARPFLDAALIERVLMTLVSSPAVLPGLPVTDSLRRVADRTVVEEVPREGIVRAQTPQGFHFEAILDAHRRARGETHTDDASVARATGMAVTLVAGDERNIKITVPEDLRMAERLLGGACARTAIGAGFDVHRFDDKRPLMLCGLELPAEPGLAGHSDADVGLHAITDAILGALADGDIGSHFPPSDARWKDVASSQFLVHARDRVRERGGRIEHVDVTLICERPKIGPHRDPMRARIAELLALPIERVSVKATTTERLGFTGRGEGIAAQATATVRLPE